MEDDLRALLACPVCTDMPYGRQVISCGSGHDICRQCFDSLPLPRLCPLCREGFPAPGIAHRNRTAENVVGFFAAREEVLVVWEGPPAVPARVPHQPPRGVPGPLPLLQPPLRASVRCPARLSLLRAELPGWPTPLGLRRASSRRSLLLFPSRRSTESSLRCPARLSRPLAAPRGPSARPLGLRRASSRRFPSWCFEQPAPLGLRNASFRKSPSWRSRPLLRARGEEDILM